MGAPTFLSALSGTNTIYAQSVAIGDTLLAFSFRDGSPNAPTLPAGWTRVGMSSATSTSGALDMLVATEVDIGVTRWANATSIICLVYRAVSAIGAHDAASGISTSVSYPTLPLQRSDGASIVVAFSGHRSPNTALETPPAGMVLRHVIADSIDEAAAFDTGGPVTAFPAQTIEIGGNTSGWVSFTVELTGSAEQPPLFRHGATPVLALRLGSSPISRVYRGSGLVWPSA